MEKSREKGDFFFLFVIERAGGAKGLDDMMPEEEQKKNRGWWRWVEWGWMYMGTLAAMGLLVGVLGMGVYHLMEGKREELLGYRCFSGMYNSARAEEPLGLGEMPAAVADVLGAHLRFEYDDAGHLQRLVHLDRDGKLSTMPGSKVAEQRLEYDDAGRIVSKRNFDAHGKAAPDASGVAERRYTYNPQGLLVETRLYDAVGNNVAPRMPGFARERISYDEQKRPVRIEYLDGQGNPMVNARGESRVEFVYNDAHGEVVRTNYVNDLPRENRAGVAIEKKSTVHGGATQRTVWYNADSKPVENPQVGALAVQRDVIQNGRYERYRRCGENGVMRGRGRVCAEHLVRTTMGGLPEWECYNADDGMPCMNDAVGYAERVCEYSPDGRLERELFWDAQGNPTFCYEQRHSREGDSRHVLRLNTDGSTELRRVH